MKKTKFGPIFLAFLLVFTSFTTYPTATSVAATNDTQSEGALSKLSSRQLTEAEAAAEKALSKKFDRTERFYFPDGLRIFAKYMLDAYGEEHKKSTAISRALSAIQGHYEQTPERVMIESLEQYGKMRYAEADRYTFLEFEIRHLDQGRGSKLYEFEFANEQVRQEVHEYHQKQKAFAEKTLIELVESHGISESASSTEKKQFRAFAQNLFSELMDLEDPTLDRNRARPLLADLTNLKIIGEHQIQIANAFEIAFAKMEEEIRSVGEKIAADSRRFAISSESFKGAGRMIQLLLGGIFKYEEREGIKNMISGSLDFPDARNYKTKTNDAIQRFKIAIQYSIPQVQKILQLVANLEGLGQEISEVFKSLQADGRASPPEVIRDLMKIESAKMKAQGVRLVSFDAKSIHAGTIAQIHKGEIEYEVNGKLVQKTVAIRIIKPGMLRTIARGLKIMKKVSSLVDSDSILRELNWPKIGPEMEGQTRGILADTDVAASSKRQGQGKQQYTHTFKTKVVTEWSGGIQIGKWSLGRRPLKFKDVLVHYKVPTVYYNSESESETRIQVMDYTPGEGLKGIREKNSYVAQAIAKGMTLRWLQVAFVKMGFFHSDLHNGNFMSRAVQPARLLEGGDSTRILFEDAQRIELEVSIVDFGMGGNIQMAQRTFFVGIALAAKMKDPLFMKNMLWNLRNHEETTIGEKELLELLARELNEQAEVEKKIKELGLEEAERQGFKRKRIEEWVIIATNAGVRLPDAFIGLSRGTGAIMILALKNAIANSFGGLMKELIKEHPKTAIEVLTNGLVPKWEMTKSVGRKLKTMCVRGVGGGK
ncbi:MAG: hypothetical protein KDD61_04675 [Bdellovibrionales bacterium]|nr:hypothetical protein [Bdellovibrionales bacterium]